MPGRRSEYLHIFAPAQNFQEIENKISHVYSSEVYKTIGYACLYKGYGKHVDQIPIEELTVSIFRESYPRKLFLTLAQQGHKIEEKYAGIYYICNLPFPVQIVVMKQLRREGHKSLKVLSAKAKKEDVKGFLKETEELCSPREKQNVDAVLQASVRANYELYEEIRRESTMCEALRELMKDEIEKDVNAAKKIAIKEGREQGIAEGRAKGRAEGRTEGEANIIRIMNKNGLSPELIATSTGKSIEDVNLILEGRELELV